MIVYEISKHSNEHVVALFSTVQYCFQTKVHPIWSLSSTTYNIITICFHFPHISFLFFSFQTSRTCTVTPGPSSWSSCATPRRTYPLFVRFNPTSGHHFPYSLTKPLTVLDLNL